MRIVVAPDKFAGTLSAPDAAEAIAVGWQRHDTAAEVTLLPMADGGPGFVDALGPSLAAAGHATELSTHTVTGPAGTPVQAQVLIARHDDRTTAYVESAQACGLALVDPDARQPTRATTVGVGELIRKALEAGADRIVVGLGGSGTTDGGAGMLAALGAVGEPAEALTTGPDGLAGLQRLDLGPARERLAGIELVSASDVDNPLTGLRGAANVFGPQKGLDDDAIRTADATLERFAVLCERPGTVGDAVEGSSDTPAARTPGAGAAGGLGYGLVLLGAERVPGLDLVADAVGLDAAIAAADLALSGEGSFDVSSRGGKVTYGVAQNAGRQGKPCVVLAGVVGVGRREMRTMGVEAAYSLVDLYGRDRALGDAAAALADAAERVARTWVR